MTDLPARVAPEALAAFGRASRHASAAMFLGNPGFADFWVRKRRRLVLLAAICSRSAWLAPPGRPVAYADLAELARLSFGSVERIVCLAAQTGDLLVARARGEDARLLRIEPTPRLRSAFGAAALGFFDRAAVTFGRVNPASGLEEGGAGQLAASRIYAEHLLAFGRTLPPGEPRHDGVHFLYLLMALARTGGEAVRGDFVRSQSAALRVVPQTIRNLLQEAATQGHLSLGPRILLLPCGAAWLEDQFAQRRLLWNRALDRLEAALGPSPAPRPAKDQVPDAAALPPPSAGALPERLLAR
ncbi:hypothetical protein [Falsiroseomonas oryziterrae]|uniref:hypothetical protein n=1 Tax=Falsiroseomonas oryziterrae TaxID=2911368 RepID=UPI001F3A5978|nr:hypothetical protein [Roseomonas sp. NPKOSM-4]